MPDVATIARAAHKLGLQYAACRLVIETMDRTAAAAAGSERTTCRGLLAGIPTGDDGPSGWLWGDTGLVRVTRRSDLERYEGLLIAAEIGMGASSIHVRSTTASTWRMTTFREEVGGTPTHLFETVALLGASLRDHPGLESARLRYRRYWRVAPDDRSRPVAARLIEFR